VAQYSQFQWEPVADLNATDRGEGGFGSTGKQ
jgi:dUTPase